MGKIVDKNREISIHAPREGSDPPMLLRSFLLGDFNPRSP